MSFDYLSTRATATRLIERFGQSAVLRKVTTGAYDPVTGTATETVTEYPVTVVVTDYDIGRVDGTLIQRGDKRILVAKAEADPQPGDKVIVGGTVYTVVDTAPLSPGGTVVLHEVQGRR